MMHLNAFPEGRGGDVALVTTQGFHDVHGDLTAQLGRCLLGCRCKIIQGVGK
jgi:hypothetical protein